jgi:hypothetical protein
VGHVYIQPKCRHKSARDNENSEKIVLIQITRGSIRDMQAHIAILRRLLWLELYIVGGPVLPTDHR